MLGKSSSLLLSSVVLLFCFTAQCQLPDLPTAWYAYFETSLLTSYSFEGNYTFSDLSSTNGTSFDFGFTNSITSFYWTTFYISFTGYWGDDYDTSDRIVEEVDDGNNSDSEASILSICFATLLSSVALTIV
mmetsp:Transcript_124091/g.185485  ORF Transcript_124091/g.185485 Transcript_124091/m.185485 type:complete len:131 (+) Transcript_124091:11-403(+)